ncbi:MAG TPA: hypothetical protein VHH32_12480 [Gemmatimonadales bacterium]|nr:hypothetical protein [Gemmatimonadales bacterium]
MTTRGGLAWQDFLTRVRARVRRSRRQVVSGRRIGESISIDRLMCPLRYDLYVRIEFVRLLREQWTMYANDLPGFLERPQSKAYYVWFKEVACARYQRQIYADDTLLRSAFYTRVHETARLWKSISGNGYDPSTPVRLQSGRSIRAVHGKTVNSTYFAGDGCHRVSCLYVMGHHRLEPVQYEVEFARSYQPLDNTAILIKKLPLSRTEYLHFLSRFYCEGLELDSVDQIRQHVASSKTTLLPELESVLAFDLDNVA